MVSPTAKASLTKRIRSPSFLSAHTLLPMCGSMPSGMWANRTQAIAHQES